MASPDPKASLFIREHREDDVRAVALLAAKRTDLDGRFVAEQIAGWQKARAKLPSWAATDGIIYPPQVSMEQCSSEATARYKAHLVERLLPCRDALIDLTGGFGIDHAFLAPLFRRTYFIEQQQRLCHIVRHNFSLLGLSHTEVRCADSTVLLSSLPHASLIYADPARRDTQGRRTYAIADCTPDVCALLPQLLRHADMVVFKLSPMLDWHQTVAELNRSAAADVVREVHIVAVGNECKELLIVLQSSSAESSSKLMMYCVNDNDVFASCPDEEQGRAVPVVGSGEPLEGLWLYEPNAALMKAGCFGLLCRRYGLRAMAANSHLFVGTSSLAGFPGRRFRVCRVSSLNKKELRLALRDITRANITVRNFPMSVADLRRRLRLADGGDNYLFATTRADGRRVLLVTLPER